MTTPYPSQIADRFLVRLPDGMREKISQAAIANQRTMTKEIVVRLQASLENTKEPYPFAVQNAIDDMVGETGCTPEQAIINLVLAGVSQGGTVLNITVGPNTTIKQVREAINAAQGVIPDDASIIFERKKL